MEKALCPSVLGLIVCVVHSMCVRVFVHVGHAKVIV